MSATISEEIIAEGLVSNLPAFFEFLRVAALTSSELLNYTNVAREVGVSAKVVRGYFEILEDTLLGYRLRPWTRSARRRLIQTEKFYLFDVGVANYLTRRTPRIGTPEFGKSFEHYIFMELLAYRAYRAPELDIRYWRTSTGREVDFVLDDKTLAIEVKASARVHPAELQSLTALSDDGVVKRRVVVSLDTQLREVRDRFGPIVILPWREFLAQLWSGALVVA
jgi:predicted AAA+ superfamily ATPase